MALIHQFQWHRWYSVRHGLFDTIDPPFAKLCFLPIQILYHNIKALIFNKNKGNNKKVETKVSGMVRVGVGRALLYQ